MNWCALLMSLMSADIPYTLASILLSDIGLIACTKTKGLSAAKEVAIVVDILHSNMLTARH